MTTDMNPTRPYATIYFGKVITKLAALVKRESVRTGYAVTPSRVVQMLVEREYSSTLPNPPTPEKDEEHA